MALLDRYTEWVTIGPKQRRQTHHLRPIAFSDAGSLKRIVSDFIDGDQNFPNVVTAAPLLLYTAPDGMRRICPTRDPQVYVEIGAPYIKPAATWQKVSLNPFTRTTNRLLSVNANVDVSLWMGGHFAKLEFELKQGYVPPNSQVAFPVGLNGLTRTGNTLFAAGVPVMRLQAPVVYDAVNRLDVRKIDFVFTTVSGQAYVLFTLPSLSGMTRPVVDPTLSLQPDATEGLDARIIAVLPTDNFGSDASLCMGMAGEAGNIQDTLIKFDLSTLPDGAIISSATCSFYATVDLSEVARTFYLYRQKRAWVEAQATWNIYSTGNNWSTAGGFHADDCEQTPIGSRAFTDSEALNEFKDFVLTPTTKAGLDLGNGWLGRSAAANNDLYVFASSDDATAANRPKLVIEYTVPTVAHRPFPILR